MKNVKDVVGYGGTGLHRDEMTWDEVLMLVAGLMIGKSTQRHTGSAGVRVDPKREPGEDDDEQGGSIYTHHVEAHLPPQSKNHLHTRVVTYHTKVQKDALNGHGFSWNRI